MCETANCAQSFSMMYEMKFPLCLVYALIWKCAYHVLLLLYLLLLCMWIGGSHQRTLSWQPSVIIDFFTGYDITVTVLLSCFIYMDTLFFALLLSIKVMIFELISAQASGTQETVPMFGRGKDIKMLCLLLMFPSMSINLEQYTTTTTTTKAYK